MSTHPLCAISSMATRQVLAELAERYRQATGTEVQVESVGGVDAARRVEAGEAFDLVFLASDAIDKLAALGHVRPESRRAVVDSSVAMAVKAGAPQPDVGTEDALRRAVLAARSIGYSTGPSGTALLKLFERWGIAESVKPRLVQARAGVPVGSLVASGEAELGFQQLSELMNLEGITLLGGMPPGLAITTTFTGAVAAKAQHPQAQAALDFMASPDTAELKRRHGMDVPQG
ncbi:substrate-binding domain-containing protein [Piscinibacter gummiphilus]|uniref:Substrate-binding domain-containing protein n=1 Tax=Piscinibacter gummiphilus TaxID=946333 RepID=A0ABZ0CSR7_9BURK|nr:substrate-binding domain-containing protein [Piscinibacter gummiphilus]WOB05923.1 substrate-binding domain-containing protein [Piscinibacter gummiphilus]